MCYISVTADPVHCHFSQVWEWDYHLDVCCVNIGASRQVRDKGTLALPGIVAILYDYSHGQWVNAVMYCGKSHLLSEQTVRLNECNIDRSLVLFLGQDWFHTEMVYLICGYLTAIICPIYKLCQEGVKEVLYLKLTITVCQFNLALVLVVMLSVCSQSESQLP